MKVLIITYYWPPAGGSGVQRWLKFTKYLPDFGITPVIYTALDAEYAVIDRSLEKEVSRDLEVIRGKILEPNRWLGKLGGKPKQSSAGFLDSKPSLSDRFLRYIRANFFVPDARRLWIKPSVELLSRYLKQNEIDLVITTGPPHSVHLIGLALKKEFGLAWVADFRDPWTSIDYFGSLPLSQRGLEKHRRLEKEVLSSADRVVVVGEQMRREFLKYNNHVKVISNGYDTEEREEEVSLDPEFTLTYAGLMNADRNPKTLWKVLGDLVRNEPQFAQDLKLRFVGSFSEEVRETLEKNGLSAHMEDLGYLDHEQVSRFQRSAQVLLLTVNQVASARGIVTGKIFEYMRAGRPVLAVGPTDGDLAAIIEETRCGNIVDFQDESGLKRSVLEQYRKYKKGVLEVNPVNIEKYHRRNLTRELSMLLREIDGTDKRENSKS